METTLRPVSLFVLAAALLLAGCEPGGGGNTERIAPPTAGTEATGASQPTRRVHAVKPGTTLKLAFVTNNASEFWNIARKGIEKAQKELKIQVDMKLPEPPSIEKQVRILEDLESQGYHGVAISALDPSDLNRQLNRLAATMNVITHDSDAPGSNRLAYIGTNNRQAGEILGKEIAKLFPRSCRMALFVGTFAADNARQRRDGLLQSLGEANVSFSIVASKEDNKDMTLAKKNVEDILNAFPDIELLVGLWAYNGPAIASAVKAAGKSGKVKVVCFDENDQTLQAIQEGVIACTIAQKPFEFGYRSSVLLHKLCTEGEAALPPDPIIDTGVTVVSADNVEEFWNNLRELKK